MRLICALLFVATLAVCHEHEPVAKTHLKSGDVKQRTNLYNHLVKEYQKNVNPDHADVEFGVSLIDFHFNEKRSTLESNVWLKYLWTDSRLQWDVKEWGGIELIRVPSEVFWKPDISLYNGADPSHHATDKACWESNMLVYATGKVLWVPPCHFSSYCQNTLRQHPYDPQTCTLKFGSWTFDSDTMDINFYKNITTVDIGDIWENRSWKVLSTTGEKHIKHYSCCTEPYADLTFNVTIQRKAEAATPCHL